MKKYSRPLCLVLTLILSFTLFSVNVYAEEAEENLVDSDLRNWEDGYDIGVSSHPFSVKYVNLKYYRISFDNSIDTDIGDTALLYKLTDLSFGEVYNFSFTRTTYNYSSTTPSATWLIGFVEKTNDTNEFVFIDDAYISFSNNNVDDVYTDISHTITFKNNSLSDVYLGIFAVSNYDGSAGYTVPSLDILKDSVFLTREASETEKKLDGILGWLEDIKDSIVGLPETIKTNFSTFFTDLQGKITDMKDGVTEKLGTLSTEFSGYITGLGDRVSVFFTNLSDNVKGFFDDIWKNLSEWFEKFKPRIEIPLKFHDMGSYYLSDFFVPYSDKFHLELPYYWVLKRYDMQGNFITDVYVTSDFNYQFTPTYDGEYYQYKISFADNGYSLPQFIYVDSGWLSAFLDGLKYEFYLLGSRLINYLLYFQATVPENPFTGVDSPLSHVEGFFNELIEYLSNIKDDIETVIDSVTGPVVLLDEFTKRFEWLFGIITFTLMMIVVSRFIGL